MKYTTEQRHNIYKKALEHYKSGFYRGGLCREILLAAYGSLAFSYDEKIQPFTEFTCFAQMEKWRYGFDYFLEDSYIYDVRKSNSDIRETILEFCIEMTKP